MEHNIDRPESEIREIPVLSSLVELRVSICFEYEGKISDTDYLKQTNDWSDFWETFFVNSLGQGPPLKVRHQNFMYSSSVMCSRSVFFSWGVIGILVDGQAGCAWVRAWVVVILCVGRGFKCSVLLPRNGGFVVGEDPRPCQWDDPVVSFQLNVIVNMIRL